ncbi:MAG TPA: TetR/AcrR family transcriptional regulator [Tenuifilaceae bacterium]|nr:TetR/AcrR family transcriptional regulator [Tenuifilaceae bacterium]HPJ45229.1 TetR/AcrR family transcriptional regulator [Tenuifilaceae bacterium]HPQ33350.1 TetR/AcrR family transcriptional regulator [Tenuifilaceae bacterium]HRX67565.1 TetR/AcrR family transcriptional regulator [Tenuifilaceae bacterium]
MVDEKLDTEKAILVAARKVFILKGLDGARMQEIADEAGINKALLHYYFRSKEKLFQMVFKEALTKFFPKVFAMMASENLNFKDKIEAFVENYLKLILENPFIPAFIIGELNKNPEKLSVFFDEAGLETQRIQYVIKEIVAKEAGVSFNQAKHLIVNIISLSIFPFVGRPLLEKIIFEGDKKAYENFLNERKKVVVDLIMTSLPKKEK